MFPAKGDTLQDAPLIGWDIQQLFYDYSNKQEIWSRLGFLFENGCVVHSLQ